MNKILLSFLSLLAIQFFTNDLFAQQLDTLKINKVRITNQNGQQVMDLVGIQGLNSINVEQLPMGLYQLQFDSNGVQHSYRFIKL